MLRSALHAVVSTRTAGQFFDDGGLPFEVIRQPTLIRLWRLIRNADVIHIAGPALLPLLPAKLAHKPVVICQLRGETNHSEASTVFVLSQGFLVLCNVLRRSATHRVFRNQNDCGIRTRVMLLAGPPVPSPVGLAADFLHVLDREMALCIDPFAASP